jgi:hypothetical protein
MGVAVLLDREADTAFPVDREIEAILVTLGRA